MDFESITIEYELDVCMRMLRLQKMLEQNGVVSVLDTKKALITVYVEEKDKEIDNPSFYILYGYNDIGLPFLDIKALNLVQMWEALHLLWRESTLDFKAKMIKHIIDDVRIETVT
ncbi:hypothetical protein SAMN05720761_12139 [Fibrobacter sp. UWCM]|uniref:hypothetical protein n=1 Tax=Fibrobacter sp. UWCM TaxID=1896208 RepID=UPI0009139623|nr:hypothetical protein [Fibrobacter sp. UWCM]SHH66416.1 hypothetical protein SAMN05720761_12139 [Fibrobacter sp. UWCM]